MLMASVVVLALQQITVGAQPSQGQGQQGVATPRPKPTQPAPTVAPPAPIPLTGVASTAYGADLVTLLEERVIAAKAEVERIAAEATAASGDIEQARRSIVAIDVELNRLAVERRTAEDDRRRHATALVDVLHESFVGGSANRLEDLLPRTDSPNRGFIGASLGSTAVAHLRDSLKDDEHRLAVLDQQSTAARARRNRTLVQQDEANARRAAAEERLVAAKAAVDEAKGAIVRLAENPVHPTVNIDVIVLDAYLRAVRRMAAIEPTCGIRWWTLAAIGLIESNNARGRSMTLAGDVSPRIIGLQLDGTGGNAAIPDSDGGSLDEDTTWDRAVGPMQFIPTTWARWGSDANGDGLADPHNIYDAALSSARYLCAGRGASPLDTVPGFAAAAWSYNRSTSYVTSVLLAAVRYQRSDIAPSRRITLVSGSYALPGVAQLTTLLANGGWEPTTLESGDLARVLATLDDGSGRPVALNGALIVVLDPSWSLDERARVAAAATAATAGLRTVVIDPAPAAPPPTPTDAARPGPQGAPPAWLPAPGTTVVPGAPLEPYCGDTGCAPWVAWLTAVVQRVG
jgi:membrane-bound lytic murein transglycosylase B